MLAISVFCAINDAIASLRPGAVPPLDAPATPEAIMRAVTALAKDRGSRHAFWTAIADFLARHGQCAMVSVS